jgi:hypothetical protein
VSPPQTGTTEITYRHTDYRDVSSLRSRIGQYYAEGRRSATIRTIAIDSGLAAAIFSPETHRER